MSKKKRLIVKEKKNWFAKVRWLLFPVLFGLGALGASYINANDLMNKVQSGSNQGVQITWFVQICTYLCVIGLIVLGYQFQSKLEKNENSK
jgi:hypothetical protein